jgi:hypothetical protein
VTNGSVPLPGLGVHEVGGQGARVTTEQHAGQGAVAPEEAGQVQADQQHGEDIDQTAAPVGDALPTRRLR